MGTITGTAHFRPVRVGFVVARSSIELVRDASRLASGVWGGVYFPILEARHPDLRIRIEQLALDVLYPLDDDPATTAVTDEAGYRWRGRAQFGPFAEREDRTFYTGLLPIDCLAAEADPAVSWAGDDPLAPVYDVWLGRAGAGFDTALSLGDVWSTGNPLARSAVARTAAHIDYRGDDPGLIVVIVGDDPDDLARLWNLRAGGGHVHPWLIGQPDESAAAVQSWLSDAQVSGKAHRGRRGDGVEMRPLVAVSAGQHETERQRVRRVLDGLGFDGGWEPGFARGWSGHHPLWTEFERDFSVEVGEDAWEVDVALPTMPLVGPRTRWPGIVAADVHVHSETGSPVGRTLSVPGVRRLAAVLDDASRDLEQFHRPSGEGRVVAVQAGAVSLRIRLAPTLALFERLLPDGAALTQSDDGRFTTQLVERLGGVESAAASQPAVREVLYAASNADRSMPLARLLRTATDARGRWPGLMSRDQPKDYATRVVLSLAQSGLLVPTVSLRCPACATEVDIRPEDLASEVRCQVCGRAVKLGLALGLQGSSNPWRYRLAAHVVPGRLRSGLAAMAANAVLRSAHRAGGAPTMPHVFGLTVEHDGWKCEVDVAALIIDGPMTLAVVGELKGGKEQINQTDLDNLTRLQQMLRSVRIESFILVGTTRSQFDSTEVEILRAACDVAPPRLNRHHYGPALPIVLSGPDMSLPWLDEGHPWRWGDPGTAPLEGLAVGGCRRNLGLTEVVARSGQSAGWDYTWQADPHCSEPEV